MGKISILTQEQKNILAGLGKSAYICRNFYFTGGTALAQFYLGHRYSDDLDLFSPQKFDNQIVLTLMTDLGRKYRFTFDSHFVETVYIFNLAFENKKRLKIDFTYYPYSLINKGKSYEGITIDSLLDIAVNKLLTVNQRSNVKDFVDLYFLLQKQFTVWDLIDGVRKKFAMKIEPLLLAQDFLKVEDFDYLPKMVKPLNLIDLQEFFREKAKKIGKTAIK